MTETLNPSKGEAGSETTVPRNQTLTIKYKQMYNNVKYVGVAVISALIAFGISYGVYLGIERDRLQSERDSLQERVWEITRMEEEAQAAYNLQRHENGVTEVTSK